jgi:hypothetical protein
MGNDLITQPSPMSEKQPTDQRLDRRLREQIGQSLGNYYRSRISEELPPRLMAVLKKLDEQTELSGEQALVLGDIKS